MSRSQNKVALFNNNRQTEKQLLKIYNVFEPLNMVCCMNLITIFVVALIAVIIVIPGSVSSAVSEG